MKKQFLFALAILTALTITGCGTANAESAKNNAANNNTVAEEPVKQESNTNTNTTTNETKTETKTETTPSADAETITIEEARAIALKDAGLAEAEVHYILEHLDHENGRSVYDIEFYHDTKEYDYEIDAATGEIIERDFDIENYEIPADQATTSSEYITAEKAKEIALAHVGLTEKDVRFEKVERDNDDGKVVYELEFKEGKTEYEFDIDAITGDILSYDKDHD